MFHWRGIRKTLSEREDTGSPSGPVILLFPSNKFPFSCLTAWLSFFFSALASQRGRESSQVLFQHWKTKAARLGPHLWKRPAASRSSRELSLVQNSSLLVSRPSVLSLRQQWQHCCIWIDTQVMIVRVWVVSGIAWKLSDCFLDICV